MNLGPLVSSTNKTDHHDISEILLKGRKKQRYEKTGFNGFIY